MGAQITFSKGQKITLISLLALLLVALFLKFHLTVIIILLALNYLYFINILISFFISYKSIFHAEEIQISAGEIAEKGENYNWPKYTILCPLYKEANVIEAFAQNISSLDYPKDRLECLLLLEEDDTETIEKAKSLDLPDYFKIVVVPDSQPKTKPKACNVGLKQATGDLLVIYDAEDHPETDQLKKAVLAFEISKNNIICVQAKLNFYNQRQNLLTKFFTSEYSLWFDLVLPGFQAINAPIPLGGTSNHFRTLSLRQLDGWDPYNVTEDCDLGIRLKKNGFDTVILNSTTWEEANSQIKNWIRQRSRWIKGYFQTFFVYTRTPFQTIKSVGFVNFFIFCMITGFLPFASIINPLLWLTTISYFVFRPEIGIYIESFYPSYVLYPAVFCLIIGNFLYIYNYLIGSTIRGYEENVKYGLLMPFYWCLISIAAWYAAIQLITKPHYWEKTQHGLLKSGESNA